MCAGAHPPAFSFAVYVPGLGYLEDAMRMWGFWTRSRQARLNQGRSRPDDNAHRLDRRCACVRRPAKTQGDLTHPDDAPRDGAGFYMYVDNFR